MRSPRRRARLLLLLLLLLIPTLLEGLLGRSGRGTGPESATAGLDRVHVRVPVEPSGQVRGTESAVEDAVAVGGAGAGGFASLVDVRQRAIPRSIPLDTIPSARPEPAPARVDSVVPTAAFRPVAAPEGRFDEGLFELRLADVSASRTILVLVDQRGRPLLPVGAMLQYLEIPHRRAAEEIQLDWPPPTWRGRIGLADRSLQLSDASSVIPAAEWESRPDDLFVGVEVIQQIIGADVHVDWENLRILVAPRRDFPIAVRVASEVRRGLLLGRSDRFGDRDDPSIGFSTRTGGFAAGWQVAVGAAGGTVQTSTRAMLGAAVLGGSLQVGSALTSGAGGASVAPPFFQYSRAFSESAAIRQIRLGQVFSEGLVGRGLEGFTLSNDPFYSAEYFGQVMIEPVVPAGWEYEVYQGDQLLGVSARGENAPIPTHLGYGTNPLRVRMIGPAGQERVQELVYLVPAMQVPGGAWRYRAGGGFCRDAACSLLSYGDVRRGLTDRTTVGAGLEAATGGDSAGWLRPYGVLSHSPRPDLRVEVRGQWETLLHASLQRYGTGGGWQASAGWSGGNSGFGSPKPHWYADGASAFTLPGVRQPLVAGARARGNANGTLEAWTGSVGTIVREFHVRAAYEHGFQLRDIVSVHASRRVPGTRGPLLRDLMVNTEADFTGEGLRHLNVGLTTRPLDHSNLNTSLRWSPGSRVPQLAISLVTRTPAAYLQTVANRAGGSGSWFASASGGLAYDAGIGAVTSPVDALGQTGIAGRVFIDLEGDGEMGEGDTPLAGVPVSIGGARVITDENGAYRYWGVLPHTVVKVGVDTVAFTRPDLTPGRPAERVRAVPNVFTQVDIPVVHTRELLGQVSWAGGELLTVGGITIEAEREEDGAVVRVLTFSDGEFYFGRLVPGSYRLRVAQSSLDALGAAQEAGAVSVEVEPRAEGAPVQAPTILIARPEPGWDTSRDDG
jgi:hypothetical protein